MTIVAHVDDDLLFMNPDVANSIAAGEASSTVYVTAGDAGREASYWQGRETGAKAAYALMAGADDWVDEIITIESGGSSYNVASSYLESAPQVRLYFMRIPDGAGEIDDPADYQSLARLEDGTRESVETVDGSMVYTREDVVNVLSGLMEAHAPQAFRLQVAEGTFAPGEHTDHIHSTEFALEAMDDFSGLGYQVTHYVNYQSDQLPPNLTDEEAAFSLEVMQAYVAHDSGASDANGNLLPVYVDWTMRQYIAESYTVTGEEEAEPQFTYSLGDHPDNFYFEVNAQTGELTIKDWFTPSLLDPWDDNEDTVYEITLIATPTDGSAPTEQALFYETSSEGELSLIDTPIDDGTGGEEVDDDPSAEPEGEATDPMLYSLGDHPDNFYFNVNPQTGELTIKDWFTPSLLDPWDANEDTVYEITLIATPTDGSAPTEQALFYETSSEGVLSLIDTPIDDGTGSEEVDDDPSAEPEGEATDPMLYSLGDHPDNFYFNVNPQTGELTIKDWFTPSLLDPWDDNEDTVYEITLIATPSDGSAPTEQFLRFETAAEGGLTLLDTADDIDPPVPGDEGTDPLPEDPPDTPTAPSDSYTLSGPDAFLFEIDAQTGIITSKDWFSPSYQDAWDQNQDHIYELTRTATNEAGTATSRDFLRYEVMPDDTLVLSSLSEDLILALADTTEPAPDAAPAQEGELLEDMLA